MYIILCIYFFSKKKPQLNVQVPCIIKLRLHMIWAIDHDLDGLRKMAYILVPPVILKR
jgi:hypothetical protein